MASAIAALPASCCASASSFFLVFSSSSSSWVASTRSALAMKMRPLSRSNCSISCRYALRILSRSLVMAASLLDVASSSPCMRCTRASSSCSRVVGDSDSAAVTRASLYPKRCRLVDTFSQEIVINAPADGAALTSALHRDPPRRAAHREDSRRTRRAARLARTPREGESFRDPNACKIGTFPSRRRTKL